jgi:hypothetical protein
MSAPRRHHWEKTTAEIFWRCSRCGMGRRDWSSSWTLYQYYRADGQWLGSSPPPCVDDTAERSKELMRW